MRDRFDEELGVAKKRETRKENFALLSDEPVLETERIDLLRFDHTAGVLARAALHTHSPITIGLFGDWGSGKTSLMHLMHDIVDNVDQTKTPPFRCGSTRGSTSAKNI
jgi:ATPase subunit of ABC transporter with duplicated ATPase domains